MVSRLALSTRSWTSSPSDEVKLVGARGIAPPELSNPSAYQRLEFELSQDALDLGLDAALPHMIELEQEIGEFGRGERI